MVIRGVNTISILFSIPAFSISKCSPPLLIFNEIFYRFRKLIWGRTPGGNKHMKKFTGYQKGNLNNEITYKCWFVITDANGFTAKEVKYLSVEEFKSLPKVGKEVK